jgi:hypothetical protein
MDQARTQFLDLLNWLRQFYLVRLQRLGELMSFVPFGTKVWLELLQAQLQVAKSLDDIEQKLRNIRMELVSLSLYAIPERLSQFLITEGPALWAFMRTGASATNACWVYIQDDLLNYRCDKRRLVV